MAGLDWLQSGSRPGSHSRPGAVLRRALALRVSGYCGTYPPRLQGVPQRLLKRSRCADWLLVSFRSLDNLQLFYQRLESIDVALRPRPNFVRSGVNRRCLYLGKPKSVLNVGVHAFRRHLTKQRSH